MKTNKQTNKQTKKQTINVSVRRKSNVRKTEEDRRHFWGKREGLVMRGKGGGGGMIGQVA